MQSLDTNNLNLKTFLQGRLQKEILLGVMDKVSKNKEKITIKSK